MEAVDCIRKINKVNLYRTRNPVHFLESIQRDTFEKKFGFTHRPPVILYDTDQEGEGSGKRQKTHLFKPDQIENYFFSSSVDNNELSEECPV